MRRFWYVCLLCGLLAWLSPAASAGQLFYDFSGGSTNVLTAIDTSTGVAHTIGTGAGYFNVYSSAFGPDGTFYAMGVDASNNPVVFTVNLSTGVGTPVGTPPASALGLQLASDNTIYTTENGELYKDPPGGSLTDVGPMQLGPPFMDFAMNSHGVLYAVASIPDTTGASDIYTIDTHSGLGTLVGTLANNPCLMGIAFDKSDNLFATEYCGGPYPLYEITGLSASNPNGATATAIGASTTVSFQHGGDIYNAPEPASLMLCLLGGVLLAARKLHS